MGPVKWTSVRRSWNSSPTLMTSLQFWAAEMWNNCCRANLSLGNLRLLCYHAYGICSSTFVKMSGCKYNAPTTFPSGSPVYFLLQKTKFRIWQLVLDLWLETIGCFSFPKFASTWNNLLSLIKQQALDLGSTSDASLCKSTLLPSLTEWNS